jgi:hypothetical protein
MANVWLRISAPRTPRVSGRPVKGVAVKGGRPEGTPFHCQNRRTIAATRLRTTEITSIDVIGA